MRQYKIFKITMMLLAGLSILFVGIYSIVTKVKKDNTTQNDSKKETITEINVKSETDAMEQNDKSDDTEEFANTQETADTEEISDVQIVPGYEDDFVNTFSTSDTYDLAQYIGQNVEDVADNIGCYTDVHLFDEDMDNYHWNNLLMVANEDEIVWEICLEDGYSIDGIRLGDSYEDTCNKLLYEGVRLEDSEYAETVFPSWESFVVSGCIIGIKEYDGVITGVSIECPIIKSTETGRKHREEFLIEHETGKPTVFLSSHYWERRSQQNYVYKFNDDGTVYIFNMIAINEGLTEYYLEEVCNYTYDGTTLVINPGMEYEVCLSLCSPDDYPDIADNLPSEEGVHSNFFYELDWEPDEAGMGEAYYLIEFQPSPYEVATVRYLNSLER